MMLVQSFMVMLLNKKCSGSFPVCYYDVQMGREEMTEHDKKGCHHFFFLLCCHFSFLENVFLGFSWSLMLEFLSPQLPS